MYVIIGATGHTGSVVAENLLKEGQKVVAVTRDATKANFLKEKGAYIAEGNLDDSSFLTKTLKGATGVYAIIPPKFDAVDFRAYQRQTGEYMAKAIQAAEVQHVVLLSSFGAHLSQDAGVVSGLYDVEKRLEMISGLNIAFLRAGFFMENFLASIGLIQSQGLLGGFPIAPSLSMPMIHTKDIGDFAAERLLKLDFQGPTVYELAGARDYTMEEVAGILGEAIHKDLHYVRFPDQDALQGMIGSGFSESLAKAYIAFSHCVNEGKLYEGYRRRTDNTTSTLLETFASQEFKYAYQQA